MFCPNCNAQLPDDAVFCGSCGASIAPSSAQPQAQQPVYQQSQQMQVPPQGGQQASGAYQQNASYQQQPYGQAPQPTMPAQQMPMPDATNRAFAMTLYVANILGIIFALAVRDKNNQFMTHHINNVVVILIGSFIGGLLSVVLIGFVLLIYLLVMAIMGIVSAYNGNCNELPLIGKIHIVK